MNSQVYIVHGTGHCYWSLSDKFDYNTVYQIFKKKKIISMLMIWSSLDVIFVIFLQYLDSIPFIEVWREARGILHEYMYEKGMTFGEKKFMGNVPKFS